MNSIKHFFHSQQDIECIVRLNAVVSISAVDGFGIAVAREDQVLAIAGED